MDNYKVTILLAVLLAVDSSWAVLTNNTGKKNTEDFVKIKNLSTFKTLKLAQDRISSFPHGKFSLPKFNFDSFKLPEFGHYRPKKFAPRLELSTLNSLPYQSSNAINLFRKPGPSYTHPSFSLGSRHPGFNAWRTGFKSPHTPVIPISLEAYGPPNKPALPSFSIGSSPFVQNNHEFTQNGFFGNELPQSPLQNGGHAPPTQPDIKYDGWQPIAGNVAAPNFDNANQPPSFHDNVNQGQNFHDNVNQGQNFNDNVPQPIYHDSNAAVPSFDSVNVQSYHDSGNLVPPNFQDPQPIFHDTGSSPTNNGVPDTFLNPEFASAPSDSYGEPIFNPEDHNLKQSVRSRDESALPPPPLPEQEPFHVQGQPDTSIPSLPNLPNHASEQIRPAPGPVGPVPSSIGPSYPIQEDSYLSPPPSSFAADGPYPSARRPGPEFGFIRTPNFRVPSRPPSKPQMLFPVSLTPPRTWAPVKFRQQDHQSSSYGSHSEASEFSINYSVPSVNLPLEKDNCNDKPHNHVDSDVSMSYNQIVVSEDSRANKISGDQLSGLISENNYPGLTDADEASNKVEQGQGQSSADYAVNHQFKSEALPQTSNDDGYQIQGSKGVYTLQIQPADGSHGTEDSDSSIRHEQVLSDGLLQNILAAIEQPSNNNANDQSIYQPQVATSFDLSGASSSLSSASVLSAVADQLKQTQSGDNIPLTDKSEQALFGDSLNSH